MTTTAPSYQNIEIPSKWDIIPIHTSDVANFMRCRRYWDWTSPTRNNLRRRVDQGGIYLPFWFGSGIHYALEMYYNPAIRRDPVEAFQTWYQLQWEGGIVTEDWLERTYDVYPKSLGEHAPQARDPEGQWDDVGEPEHLYRIRGLQELIPDPDINEFEDHKELGVGMMKFYKEYAPKYDHFEVVAAESQFSVPIPNPDDPSQVLKFIDVRTDSPNYGKILEVHARGKRDAIIVDLNTKKYGIIDHKTATKVDEDYFEKLEKDPQCMNYMWASQVEAHLNGFPWKRIDEVIYQGLRKAYPSPPTTLSDGISPSLARSTESTTPELFAAYIKSHGLTDWFNVNEKAKKYYDYLVDQGNDQFIVRKVVHHNEHELYNVGIQLGMIAQDMLGNPRIYPRPTGDRGCTRCAFRAPCLATDDGSYADFMISEGYEHNRGR